MTDFTSLLSCSKQEILELLNLADQFKYEQKNNIENKCLSGKTLGMIFEKSSTRTRVSFEVGMYQLGGNAMFLSSNELQLGKGEPMKDTARVLSRYLDAIMIRTYDHKEVLELAKYASIPVINGLSDFAHPCQALADLLTIREYKTSFKNLKVCFIGDTYNVSNSLLVGCMKMNIPVTIACPEGYYPCDEILALGNETGLLTVTHDKLEAAKDADVIYTDVWYSMGQESEIQKRKIDFASFSVDNSVLSAAKPDALVLHCLPAHRGEEISDEILEAHADEIFNQTENRLHVQKAILATLIK